MYVYVVIWLQAEAVCVGASLVFLVLTFINIYDEGVQTGMNIHFALRPQTGGVTEISISVTEISL